MIYQRATKVLTATAVSAALVLTAECTAAAATTESARTHGAAVPMKVHRGHTKCFSWSYGDGTVTETVYYHNKCHHTAQIHVWWETGGGVDILHAPKVKAGGKGHIREDGSIKSIS